MSKKQVVEKEGIAVCQDCGYHKNKPSRCKKNDVFVPRKRPASDCGQFQAK